MTSSTIISYFDSRAEVWDEICRHDPGKLSAITSLCGIREGWKVLDIACGTGVMVPHLKSAGASCIKGIDISPSMIEIAKKKHPGNGISFEAADLYCYKEEGFNAAIIYSAYPHFEDKELLAEKLASLLVPGGRFLVAHSESAASINSMHDRKASDVSVPLLPAEEEAAVFCGLFNIDIMVDTQEFYIISGTRR